MKQKGLPKKPCRSAAAAAVIVVVVGAAAASAVAAVASAAKEDDNKDDYPEGAVVTTVAEHNYNPFSALRFHFLPLSAKSGQIVAFMQTERELTPLVPYYAEARKAATCFFTQ